MTKLLSFFTVCVCLFITCNADDDDHGEAVVSFTSDSFKEEVPKSHHFVMFFAPWCGHCKRLGPTFNQLAEKFNDATPKEVTIAKVDCTVETALCSEQGVRGYPTIKFFTKGEEEGVKYQGKRDVEALEQYIKTALDPEAAKPKEEAPKPAEAAAPSGATGGLHILAADSFGKHVEKGHHFIKFYAPWCGHCKRLEPAWEKLAKTFENDDSITINKIDCTQHGSVCSEHGVRGYPTLLFFTDGKNVDKYAGAREHDNLRDYVNKMKAKTTDEADHTHEKIPDAAEKPKEEKHVPGLVILTEENMMQQIGHRKALIMFYAPWCPHCVRLEPFWDRLADKFKAKPKEIAIAKMDCTEHRKSCTEYDVKGFPTILYFENGKMVEKYSEGRELEYLIKYVNQKLGIPDPSEDKWSPSVVELTQENFDKTVETGATFVMFFAPWCGHCKKMKPDWHRLGDDFEDKPGITIASVDCTDEKDLCKEYDVQGFPTLFLFTKGDTITEYKGVRSYEKLKTFVLDNLVEARKEDAEEDSEEDDTKQEDQKQKQEKIEL